MLVIAKPLVLWVNDLWMAVFFFLVGLEIKREFVEGELASRSQAMLPAAAALGGMVVPALIYVAVQYRRCHGAARLGHSGRDRHRLRARHRHAARLARAGLAEGLSHRRRHHRRSRRHPGDRVFYTANLSLAVLGLALVGVVCLVLLNRAGVRRADVYIVVGLAIWVCVLKSGIHATLAGVLTALTIPMKDRDGAPLAGMLEHGLHPWVAFLVLPMFAFANAGVTLTGLSPVSLLNPIPLGIAAGLVIGKSVGVFGTSWLMIRSALATAPAGASSRQLFGVCVLCGIGFTMSLFIGALAFEGMHVSYEAQLKLGVLAGSLIAGMAGTLILRRGVAASNPARSGSWCGDYW